MLKCMPVATKIEVLDESGNTIKERIVPVEEVLDMMSEEQKEQVLNAMPEKERKMMKEALEVKDNG